MNPYLADVERWLERLYVAADGATLRAEDRRKAVQVAALLLEIERALARVARSEPVLLVDAAAGKAYVGLLAARLLLQPSGRRAAVVTIEREACRVAASRAAAARLGVPVPIDCREAEVGSLAAWPDRPTIVVALHACGPAADQVIDAAVATGARHLLLVPCCTGRAVESAGRAVSAAEARGIPPHAPVRGRFVQALVDAERTWRLESAGYETEVVELVPPTLTPHNLLWRARLVGEPNRMARALRELSRLRSA